MSLSSNQEFRIERSPFLEKRDSDPQDLPREHAHDGVVVETSLLVPLVYRVHRLVREGAEDRKIQGVAQERRAALRDRAVRATCAPALLHRRVESGKGDDLLRPLETVQRRELGENGRSDEGRDSGDRVEVLQIVPPAPFSDNGFLHGLASFFEKREDAVLGNASIFFEVPLVQKIDRGGGAELPVVPHERLLLRQLRRLDKTKPVPLRC